MHGAERDAGAGHADGAERDEAVLDLVAAEQAGDHAADADADGESGVEIAGLSLADVQNIGTVDDDGGEEQRAEEPEVGVAENREEERLIAAHERDLLPEIADEVEAEFLFGCGGGNAVDAEAGGEACAGEGEERVSGVDFVAMEMLGHGGAGDGADDDGEEGAEFDDAIAPGEALGGEQFRQQAVFRRAEERGLRGDEPERDERERLQMEGEAGGGDGHGADLHDLGPDGDLALAEAVGEPAAGHAEEHEGHGEEEGDDGDEGVALVIAQAHADDHGEQKIAQDVIAVCALELRSDQRPEAALAMLHFRPVGGLYDCGIFRWHSVSGWVAMIIVRVGPHEMKQRCQCSETDQQT